MDKAPKDVLVTIAMDLDLPSLLRWCQSSSRIQRDVCNNQNVWRGRLLRDYPDYERFNLKKSLKETYVFMYQLELIKQLLGTKESLYDIFLRPDIDLSEIELKKVPAFDLPNLQVLNLSFNKLTKLPKFDLPSVRYLFLSNNQLKEVPVFDFPKLEELYLQNNQLTEVPEFRLPKLETLNLHNNRFGEEKMRIMKSKYGHKVLF